MKNKYLLVALLLLVFLAACEKEVNTPAPQLEGKWILIATTGGISEKGTPITNKQTAIFKDGTYKLLANDLQLNANTYRIEPGKGSGDKAWQLRIGYREIYFIRIKDGLLHLYSPEADSVGLIYKKT
ncbi:MAG: hypothetical protein J7623_17250 [Chitinophaga sp.]|uniref:hypothetical protein n=1 Tax=Chitinophaga sp. TaxID=1869181 RepID=UPI001B26EA3C|nr:hypothetical protein [Chitinophaga sp.]MBO9730390.1 hypothetical protein [Chitinophaga sp.]